MSYNNPYSSSGHQDTSFNPYEVQRNQTRGGYEGYADGGYGGYTYENDPSGLAPTKEKTTSFHDGAATVPLRPPLGSKTPRNMKRWRKEYQGDMWTKGSRASCVGRFFCCTIMIFLFFLISIVLSLALWLRPPNIIIGQPSPDLSTLAINDSRISFGLPVDISVNNPNYFTVTLSSLDASVIYPIQNTEIGSGSMKNIPFKDHTQTNFTFPVTIAYNADSDPNGAVLLDLARHCGLDSSVAPSDVSVTVNIKLGLKIILVSFSTSINQKVSFGCPLGNSVDQLADMLKALGININNIAGLLGAI